jgi:hypothetical protein
VIIKLSFYFDAIIVVFIKLYKLDGCFGVAVNSPHRHSRAHRFHIEIMKVVITYVPGYCSYCSYVVQFVWVKELSEPSLFFQHQLPHQFLTIHDQLTEISTTA